MGTLTNNNGTYTWLGSFAEKDIAKAAGFRWNPDRRCWWTSDATKAAKLARFADAGCKATLEAVAAKQEEALAASRATDADVELPCPDGLAYLPFQRAGIAYALQHPNVLFGDEMGLGKTIQAIGVINADPTIKRALVVCPASLRLNWQRELRRWLVRTLTVGIANDIFPTTDVVIVNYDILKKHQQAVRAFTWDALIVDEVHYTKNPDAIRTRQVWGHKEKKATEWKLTPIPARRRLALTGTPIVNRPIELWTIANSLAPATFSSFWGYARRYCNAQQGRYGWDLSGASNLDELQDQLRSSCMVRRLKRDVLTELPAKRRQIIELPANGASGAVAAEREAWAGHEQRMLELRAAVELAKASEDPADYAAAVGALKQAAQVAFEELSRCRHDTALAKVPYVIDHMTEVLEAGGKVILFAHHHDVIEAYRSALSDAGHKPAVLTGETPMAARQAAVDAFQTDESVRVFIGSITAAGVGLTLTAAAHVVFAELDWVPGNLTQAEDRAHRIGQTESVLVQHIVLEGSLDARMAEVLVEKQSVIDAALDRQHEDRVEQAITTTMQNIPAVPGERGAATLSAKQAKIAKEAEEMTDEQAAAVHANLRLLACMDQDYAAELNGMGFNRLDVQIGHSLAERTTLTKKQAALGRRLIRKYRRQLGADALAACGCKTKEED